MRNKLLYSLIGAMLILPGIVQADTVSYSAAIALEETNWNHPILLQMFDTNLGTLNSITFGLTGTVAGDAKFENLDSAPATVEMDLKAEVSFTRPDASVILITLPTISTSDAVSAFDGTIDFSGTSGRTYEDIEATQYLTTTTPPPVEDLALFSAPGENFIELFVDARALSFATGSGNMTSTFRTLASAGVEVTYDYTAAATPGSEIPEPGTMLLLGTGLIGLLGYSRRRKTA